MLSLAGCTRNTLIIAAQPQAGTVVVNTPSCWLPIDKDKNYKTPLTTKPVLAIASDAAKNAHVGGCAAVIFQISRAGKAKNITLLREFPAGFGYAQAVTDSVLRTTYQAPGSESDWYYTSIGIGFTPGVPLSPTPLQTPAKPIQHV